MTIGALLGGGFRLIRERPGAMLIWTFIQLVAAAASGFAMAAIVQDNEAALLGGASAQSAATSYMFWTCLLSLGQIAVGTVVSVAAQRAILHPDEGGPGWLKLGMDEIRQFLLAMLYLVIFILSLIVALVFAAPFVAGAGAAGLQVVTIVLLAGAAMAFAFFGTRLSLTFPLTLKRRAYAMREGWALTKGRFWTLFATFLIIFVIMIAFSLLSMIATEQEYLLAISRFGLTSNEAAQASMRQYHLLMAGTLDLQIVLNWVLAAIQLAVVGVLSAAAAATAVQQLTADEEGLSETFA